MEYLHRGNVRRVVVGHKPSGEAPAILRTSGVDGKGCLGWLVFQQLETEGSQVFVPLTVDSLKSSKLRMTLT